MRHLVYTLAIVFTGSIVQRAPAESKPNPYQAIIERNPFGLKPPPPPPDPSPPAPAAPLAKVVLTGISSMFGVRALLEITEQEPGKTPATRKPILKEGERDGSVEVVSIDVEKSLVKIRNGGSETNITFDAPKLSPGAPPPMALPGAFPPPPLTTAVPGVFSPANAAANNAARNNGMTVYGNTTPPSGAASRAGVTGAGTDNSGLRSIPTRNVRADGSGMIRTYPPPPPVPGR